MNFVTIKDRQLTHDRVIIGVFLGSLAENNKHKNGKSSSWKRKRSDHQLTHDRTITGGYLLK